MSKTMPPPANSRRRRQPLRQCGLPGSGPVRSTSNWARWTGPSAPPPLTCSITSRQRGVPVLVAGHEDDRTALERPADLTPPLERGRERLLAQHVPAPPGGLGDHFQCARVAGCRRRGSRSLARLEQPGDAAVRPKRAAQRAPHGCQVLRRLVDGGHDRARCRRATRPGGRPAGAPERDPAGADERAADHRGAPSGARVGGPVDLLRRSVHAPALVRPHEHEERQVQDRQPEPEEPASGAERQETRATASGARSCQSQKQLRRAAAELAVPLGEALAPFARRVEPGSVPAPGPG